MSVKNRIQLQFCLLLYAGVEPVSHTGGHIVHSMHLLVLIVCIKTHDVSNQGAEKNVCT